MDSQNIEGTDFTAGLDYNTSREPLSMPEYGRNVLKMAKRLLDIPDRSARTRQAAAIVKVMEILNPQVRTQESYEHKLWDQLYMIAGPELDVDSPFPRPEEEVFSTRPVPIPMKEEKIKATHYGRNIEKIIDLLCNEPDSETKTGLIRALALYMRQQYLIWNKDNVADETIFNDIRKLSDYRLDIPEGLSLGKIDSDANYSRPGIGGQGQGQKTRQNHKNNRRNKKRQ